MEKQRPTMKQAISMQCTEEQFEELRVKLEENNIAIFCNSSFYGNVIIVNNLDGFDNLVTNLYASCKDDYNRTYYPTFNIEIFLEACGVETKQTPPKPVRFKLGDKIHCLVYGDGEIEEVQNRHETGFPIKVRVKQGIIFYTPDGRFNSTSIPTLFLKGEEPRLVFDKQYPKVMEVSRDNENWVKRVVFV